MYTVVMNTIIIVYPTWAIINVFMGYAKLLVMNTAIDLGRSTTLHVAAAHQQHLVCGLY